MIRKVWMGLVLALLVSVLTAGFSADARTCRRITIWIGDDPYLSHPICMDLPAPVEAQTGQMLADPGINLVLPRQ